MGFYSGQMSKLKIISWNVNGIRSCIKKGLYEWLEKTSPDVVCLQETKAKPEQLKEPLREPKGYHAYWHSAQRPGYSGVLCLCKQKPQKVTFGIGEDRFDIEGRVIQLDYDGFKIVNQYVPNGGRELKRVDFKLDYYQTLMQQITTWHHKKIDLVLTGDWNTCHQEIDLARPEANVKNTGFLPEERAWLDRLMACGLHDSFREENPNLEGAYSWWSNRSGAREKNIGWRLDYFLVSNRARKRVLGNSIHPDVLGSDHCPVELIWEV